MFNLSFWIGLIIGFVLGIVANFIAAGVPRMFSKSILKRRIVVKKIKKLQQGLVAHWVVSISIQPSKFLNIFVDQVSDLTPCITFIQRGVFQRYESVWLNMNSPDQSFIGLRLGSIRNVAITESRPEGLFVASHPRLSGINQPIQGNYDIRLELISDDSKLGIWEFKNAIIDGVMQEVGANEQEAAN
jgi:hypothetical protein